MKHQIFVKDGKVVGSTIDSVSIEVIYLNETNHEQTMDINSGVDVIVETHVPKLPKKMIVKKDFD
jgi:hypothetical protein